MKTLQMLSIFCPLSLGSLIFKSTCFLIMCIIIHGEDISTIRKVPKCVFVFLLCVCVDREINVLESTKQGAVTKVHELYRRHSIKRVSCNCRQAGRPMTDPNL